MAEGDNQEVAGNTRSEPLIRIDKYLESLDKTRDAVFKKLIRLHSVQRARTASGWADLLEDLKNRPAQ